MNLPAFCIRRPAFTIVISLVMIIIGLIGYNNLPVRWVPNVSSATVSVSTIYPGANAKLVENDVTKVIEDSLSGVSGVDTLTSTSRQGSSQINITFKLGYDLNVGVEDVRSAIDRVRNLLPKDIEPPVVAKADRGEMPILFLSFSNPHYNERELSDYAKKYITPVFETIDGVGGVYTYGERLSAMKVSLNPAKMAGANVTVGEITELLQTQNASIPSGQIRGSDRYYSVVTNTGLKTPAQFNDLIIRDKQNQVVRLKDIGEASIQPKDIDSAFRVDGKSAIAIGIIPQSTANPLDVEKNVQKALKELKRTLPFGMKVTIDYNQADYIRASMNSVYEAFIEAIIFVWLVILAFLCSFRATFIPVITIPVCLISTFALLYFFGFSINTITLMAFVLAIGLVVDDAIVMLENISRHMENGLSPFSAALIGSKEIIFPIIAMTITLTAVYAPIAFTSGLLGILFKEFTFTLAGAVLISGVIALTLSPMMCARILKPAARQSRYQRWFSAKLAALQQFYQRVLSALLIKRKWIVLALAIIAILGYGVFKWLPSELAPAEDMSEIDVFAAGPHSASFNYLDHYAKQLESVYKDNPDITSSFSIVGGGSSAYSYQVIKLKPKNERTQSIQATVQGLTQILSNVSGVRVNVSVPPPTLAEFAGGDQGDSLGLTIMTAGDYRKLQQISENVMTAIKKVPGFVHVDNRLKWDSEQFQIDIDREKAADLDVAIPDITNTISTLIAGKTVGKVDDADIIVQMNQRDLANPNIFEQLYVRNASGKMVSLNELLNIRTTSTPKVFHHANRLRSDTIYLTLDPNFKLAKAVKTLQKIAKETVPEEMKYTFTGEAKSFLDSNGKTIFTFSLALIFIYLVLVAQFESFIDPLVIMLTVPFAIVGAMFTLKVFGASLNIYSNIGLITLVGLIAKHGILITEFANRLREEGKSIHDAVIQASLLRLRPILMTTSAMILGALPLALAFGPGSESRQQIGLVITGGLLFGTFFSLVVVPIAYTYLAPFRKITPASTE